MYPIWGPMGVPQVLQLPQKQVLKVSLNKASQGCAHMAHSGVMLKLNIATYQCT